MTQDAPSVPFPVGAVTRAPRPMLVTDAVTKFGRTLDEILGMMDDGSIGAAVPMRFASQGQWFDDTTWPTGTLPDGKPAPSIPIAQLGTAFNAEFIRVTIHESDRFNWLVVPTDKVNVGVRPSRVLGIEGAPHVIDKPRDLGLETGRPIGLAEPFTLADGRIVKFVWCKPLSFVTLPELYIPFGDLPTLARIEPLPLVHLANAPARGVEVAALLDRAQRGQSRLVCLPMRLREHAKVPKAGAMSRVAWSLDFESEAGGSARMRAEPRGVGALAPSLADGADFRSLVTPGAHVIAKRFEAVMAPGALMPHDDVLGVATSVWAYAGPPVALTIADLWILAADLEAARSTVAAPTPSVPKLTDHGRGTLRAMSAMLARLVAREVTTGEYGTEDDPDVDEIVKAALTHDPDLISLKHFAAEVNAGLAVITGTPRKRGRKPVEHAPEAPPTGKTRKARSGKARRT